MREHPDDWRERAPFFERWIPARRAAAILGATLFAGWVASCANESGTTADPATAARADDDKMPVGIAAYSLVTAAEARRATGRAQIGEATRVLETAGNDCGVACPAVQTFRLGVHHMCALSETKDDAKVCKEVSAQLLAAETRLKPSCGPCATRPDAGEDAAP